MQQKLSVIGHWQQTSFIVKSISLMHLLSTFNLRGHDIYNKPVFCVLNILCTFNPFSMQGIVAKINNYALSVQTILHQK